MTKQIESVPSKGKEMTGKVVSAKMTHTVIVEVTHFTRHRLYNKAVRRTKRFAVHNPSLILAVGDHVRVVETKPISKTKHFIVKEKVS